MGLKKRISQSISNLKVFHFHDTSVTAGMKRLCALHDNDYLRSDASNLAAYLFQLQDNDYALWPRQLSDGSIRFICLTVALMGT